MTTYPLATLAAQVTDAGISAPAFADVLASLQASYRLIYGADCILTADTQDGQWIAIQASAVNDVNSLAIAVYNAFSPSTARGAGLSSVVKINGLRRLVPTNSTQDVAIVGPNGTLITKGIVKDAAGNSWDLPTTVTIPSSGTVTVTVVAETQGALASSTGAAEIANPQRGWQSATFLGSGVTGAPTEADAALRGRQSISTALPALTVLDSTRAQIANLTGVTRSAVYENDTSTTDGNGVPSHSIAAVVEGGSVIDIANAILDKKGPGCGTYGTTSEVVSDPMGVPSTINFFRPSEVRIIASVTLTPLAGFVSTTEPLVQQAMSNWVAGLSIGDDVALNDLVAVAKLPAPLGNTYKIEYGALQIGTFGAALGTNDIPIAFNGVANLAASDIAIGP